jgi:hypothetical protein
MSNSTVAAALSARLATLSLPTQWENSSFTPSASQTYLAEAFLPATTTAVGIASTSSDELAGIYQVTVLSPRGGTKGPGRATAEQVIAAFPRGLRLTRSGITVTILRTSMGPALMQGDRWAIPVSIDYRAFA